MHLSRNTSGDQVAYIPTLKHVICNAQSGVTELSGPERHRAIRYLVEDWAPFAESVLGELAQAEGQTRAMEWRLHVTYESGETRVEQCGDFEDAVRGVESWMERNRRFDLGVECVAMQSREIGSWQTYEKPQ